MSHRRAKRIRKELFSKGMNIQAEPYMRGTYGNILAAGGRRYYQARKRGEV